MSVLGRRLAGAEGAYFLQESKNAAGRLAATQKKTKAASRGKEEHNSLPPAPSDAVGKEQTLAAGSADVLPEILRHSIPLRCKDEVSFSSFFAGSKWNLSKDPVSSSRRSSVINPLRDYLSLPQVTLGPRRWQLPHVQSSILASTANELRRDKYPQSINPEKLKAAAVGLSQIGKAFAIATAVIFGGATSVFAFTASKLEIQNEGILHNIEEFRCRPKVKLKILGGSMAQW